MAISDFFMKLTPKDKKFYPLFVKQIASVEAAVADFSSLLSTTEWSERLKLIAKIKTHELAGDTVTTEVFDELYHSFITPFDREDIHLLANTIDSILDFTNRAAKQIELYQMKSQAEAFNEIASILIESVSHVKTALSLLSNMKNAPQIKETCMQIKACEKKADVVYQTFITELFSQETDAVKLIKTKDVFESIEEAVDTCKGVAEVLLRVVVKNS